MSEPKDAAAARRIVRSWQRPLVVSPSEYAFILRKGKFLNNRDACSAAKNVVCATPPVFVA